ncbi:MAG: class I SAM-dependent methyltransferase [Oscillospiraceae bacterium]|nr:class I SAM-dependent methyltransferase [Oscillospiraceae bacterium]
MSTNAKRVPRRDYELIDCSSGERLERWGEYILIRPDPQIIWKTPKTHKLWSSPHARYARSDSGGGHWVMRHDRRGGEQLPKRWQISHGGLDFYVGAMNFKHTGLFPEQAKNWEFLQGSKGLKVLNLFAYTGGATLACAKAGAEVTHVDAAKGMVQWAKDNAALNGVSNVRWIVDDCQAFAAREIRRGKRYDALILDPPSYGRGPDGQTWKLEDDLYDLLMLCRKLLPDKPAFVLLNMYTAGLSALALARLCESVFGGASCAYELGLPITTGGVLPCGASCQLTINN